MYNTILSQYLEIFSNEEERQSILKEYLNSYNQQQAIDWNNFAGHIVASGFIYSKKDKKFLVLYHKDLNMFLYPGGHIDENDKDPLQAAIREIQEETGLKNLKLEKIVDNELIPFDIDTHIIDYNTRLDLPEHHHFDFRYLFTVDNISDIKIDTNEHSKFKWIDINELQNDNNYGKVANKIIKLFNIN